ncbi:putative gustatory receptor 28b [Diprion similis]|uniref:putative gustatory receptor 28b n=1 Tax=Diprion similis TaxID=362088 RepID=UPI001EF8991C|nr:putative gustatory receptor 28b [Diprion similis]
MFCREPKTFHDAIKPLTYANWVLGIGIFRQPKQSAPTYYCMQVLTVIFNIMNWTFIYVGVSGVLQVNVSKGDSPVSHKSMYRVLICTSTGIAIIATALVWLKRKELKSCLRNYVYLDDIFQSTFGIKNDYKVLYIRLYRRVIAVFLVIFSVAIYDFAWMMKRERSMFANFCVSVTIHQPMLVTLLLDLNFCASATYVKEKFRHLNNILQEMGQRQTSRRSSPRLSFIVQNITNISEYGAKYPQTASPTSNQHQLLHEIQKAHWELSRMAKKLNGVFGMQNLLFMGSSFVITTGMLYTMYSAYVLNSETKGDINRVIPPMILMVISSFKIWVTNHSCWDTSNEAQKTGEVIYELFKPNVKDERLQKQIHEFSVQMIQNPVKFDACGFFYMDYTFVQSVIGSITTYLVILIQMSH